MAQVLALLATMAGLLVFVTSGSSAAEVAPIVDFTTYPPTLPATCTAVGAGVLEGEQFSAGGSTVANLRDLALSPGQTITMTWTGFAPGCEGVGVGLSTKVAPNTVFSQTADYFLHSFVYCGPETGATPCSGPPFQLQIVVPSADAVPCYQIDAHVGPPLIRVGPNGAYYGVLNGVRDMLVSANNGGTGTCGPLPPCASNPQIPESAFACQTTPTTPPPTTEPPTTEPPTTVTSPGQPPCSVDPSIPANSPNCVPCPTNPSIPASSASCNLCNVAPGAALPEGCLPVTVTTAAPACTLPLVLDPATGRCVSQSSGAAELPVTGRDAKSLSTTGALFLLAGLCIAYAYRRPLEVN